MKVKREEKVTYWLILHVGRAGGEQEIIQGKVVNGETSPLHCIGESSQCTSSGLTHEHISKLKTVKENTPLSVINETNLAV